MSPSVSPQAVFLTGVRAPHLKRLFDPSLRKYVHLSGHGWVSSTDYAWSGTLEQAKRLRQGSDTLSNCEIQPIEHSAREVA